MRARTFPLAERISHSFVSALGQSPCGHLAGSPVRQNPIGPTCVIERKGPAEFDGIHAEQIQHVGVNNRELLHGIINAHRLGWQPQMLPQLCVGNRRDPGRAMPGKIDGNPVRLAVLERRQHTFAAMSSPDSSNPFRQGRSFAASFPVFPPAAIADRTEQSSASRSSTGTVRLSAVSPRVFGQIAAQIRAA